MPTMYDAVDVAAIPASAEMVAGYVDGNWPTFDSLATAFPNAVRVSITTVGGEAQVADCETGDLTPQSAAHWAAAQIAEGKRPTIYYARSNAPAVSAALAAAGVTPSQVDFWVADWTGSAHLVPGSVATQWASPGTGSGGNFDVSEVTEEWPTTVPAPEPSPTPGPAPVPPAPTPSEEETEMVEYQEGGQQHIVVRQATRTVHYWQPLPGTAPPGAPPDFYDWRSEVLPEPA